MRVILLYSKYGMVRFISAKDTVRAIERNLRRAKVPMLFTKGFHPHPIMSFLDSSPTGVVNRALYFSIEVEDWSEEIFERIVKTAARGLEPREYWIRDIDINSLVDGYAYSIIMEREAIGDVTTGIVIEKGRKREKRALSEMVEDFEVRDLKRFVVVKYTLKRENVFSPWEVVKKVKISDGIFVPVLEEALSGKRPLREVLEG